MNPYEWAIYQVGSILEKYDNDRKIPVFGYGGIPYYTQDWKVSHMFSLNGSSDGYIEGGIMGIL